MNIKRSITFELTKQKKDGVLIDKNVLIRLVVTYSNKSVKGSSQRIIFSSGYRIDKSKWDKDKQRVSSGCTNKKKQTALEINADLSKYESILHDLFKFYEVNECFPSTEQVKTGFNEKLGRENNDQTDNHEEPIIEQSFFDYFDEFTRTMGRKNEWTKATYTKFGAIRMHLHTYNKKLNLQYLSEDDLESFVRYMHDAGLRNTTIQKNISFVRWFIRWCFSKGYYTSTLHESYRPKFKGTDGNSKEVIHLTWEELMHLLDFSLPETKQYLARVRDVFCFTCFTGLRYSDVYKLRRSDVKANHIEIVTQKTVDGLKIELNKYSRAILEKYTEYHFEDDKALPVISNTKMNVYLKELGELAKLSEPQRIVYFLGNERHEEVYPKYALLTTHCGRRTFIVNALYLGISAEVIMKWTGHSDYKAMKPYVKIVDALKANEMDKFNRV